MNRPWLLPAVMAFSFACGATQAAEPNFARDIRPLLSKNCFNCHGPDEATREAGLRLDRSESATQPADSGATAIVPGKPDESELIRRIFSEDESEQMPPPSAKSQLTPEQKETLRRWIAAGAEYTEHWAFVPPQQAPLPAIKQTDWPRNEIDRFILAKLEAAGLAPSPPADRYTLVRRVYLDLVGLPPTPQQVDAFLADASPHAYEALVDRLLASEHYGERWARPWLDLARYADTNGYEKDRPRSIWPYRDWVINALNADMPFDQFTLEQLAGDMLPEATQEQIIATGFHRNTMLNEEGGIDPLEFRFHAMTDRVATTGATWLGLTVGCAQCHTHKYDPIAHTEYYGMLALLNNADEPDLTLPDAEQEAQYQQNLAQAERLLAEAPFSEERFAAWLAEQRTKTVAWTTLRPSKATSNMPLLTLQDDGSVFVTGDTTKLDTYDLTYRLDTPGITAIRLEALPDERLPAHGPGMTYYEGTHGDFFLGEFQLRLGNDADTGPLLKFSRVTHNYAKNRFGDHPNSALLATDGDVQTGWSVDGRQGERHTAVFVLEQPLAATGELHLRMIFGRHFASSLGRFRVSMTTDPRGGEARDLSEEFETWLALPDDQLSDAQRTKLRHEYLLQSPEMAEQAKRIRQLQKRPQATTTLVMRERPAENPRPTFRHHRGEFLQPQEPVEPTVPAALPPLPAGAPRNRLTFARWLASSENPLTARVTVNRHWAAIFGVGLVRTLGDFGVQGEAPSHPELLDWLAVQFMQEGWSMKKLHRKLVTSATYRQSSRLTPELLAQDPENRLLGRGPRVRLEAELIRDAALQASGLLSHKVGGPSVFPPQPASVTTEGTYGQFAWKTSEGEDRYRRSLYTFSKRTAPFALYLTFDGPSGEACVARRDVSNTPLQALSLLNDQVFLEAAQALGKTLAEDSRNVEARLEELFRRCLVRPPTAEEREDLASFYESLLSRFQAKPQNAAAAAGSAGERVAEQAAWTAMARMLMNLDEFVSRN